MEIITKNNIKKYLTYKNSGVEWLGEIPEHWEVKRLKFIGNSIIGLTYSPNNLCEKNEGTLVFRSSNLFEGKIKYGEKENVYVDSKISDKLMVKENDILICSRNGSRDLIGKCALISKKEIGASFGAFTTVFRSEINPYIFCILNSSIFKILAGSFLTSTINQLTIGNLNSISVPLPPLSEQTKIAKFLDDKTQKIDEAIAIKSQQINLLKERKQILIHKAVTRGLDTNVKLKNSGVEWIGDIPVHWEVSKNGYISRIIRGASPRPAGHPMYFDGIDIPWLAVGDITKDENIYLNESVNFLTKAGKKQSRYILKGTFVLSNSGATLGVPKILNISGCINDGILAFLDLKEDLIDKIFLYYYFSSQTKRLRDEMNQGATQPNLNTDLVKQLPIALPPLSEQKEISSYIEKSSEKIATAIGLKSEEIEKLKEYKSSLINSVVTGKVRVC
ncbi:restriction endonuclease subunit S [Tenacibaculum piscium]|uniref:restriction endonuclease subunit S n=1 Tax=Tenacibaculum piscium TaxID=1458515 RepID=UPI001F47A1E7|nr:restriction endonuclease subunit S [Tenacibaculum piscium]